jgi:hypothetical protein
VERRIVRAFLQGYLRLIKLLRKMRWKSIDASRMNLPEECAHPGDTLGYILGEYFIEYTKPGLLVVLRRVRTRQGNALEGGYRAHIMHALLELLFFVLFALFGSKTAATGGSRLFRACFIELTLLRKDIMSI